VDRTPLAWLGSVQLSSVDSQHARTPDVLFIGGLLLVNIKKTKLESEFAEGNPAGIAYK